MYNVRTWTALLRILITGGAGFIGANLARSLLASDRLVRVLDDFSVGERAYLEGLDLEICAGDVRDSKAMSQAVAGMDGIVHLAAQTGVPGSLDDPYLDCEVNVIGTLNALEASRREGVRHFIFASSNAPLGRQPPPAKEDMVPMPISPYGASKLAGEGYCMAYHGSWGLNTTVLRFANVYGPFSLHKNSVIAKFFKDILVGRELTIDGDGKQTRDFIFVEDLCRAILLALDREIGGEIFQIATGVETSIEALVARVEEVVGRKVARHSAPARQGDIRKNYASIQKAHEVLGWQPEVKLRTGLSATWSWLSSF